MDYSSAVDLFATARNPERGKPLCNNTRLYERPSPDHREHTMAVCLHATDVITFYPDGSFEFNTGGWRTVTTKDRINSYKPECIDRVQSDGDGGWEVAFAPDLTGLVQPKRPDAEFGTPEWDAYYAAHDDYYKEVSKRRRAKTVPFFDGIRFAADGTCLNGPSPEQAAAVKAARKKMRNDIKRYIGRFVKQMEKPEGIPVPSNGDCWYCLMFNKVDTHPVERQGFTVSNPSNDIGKDHSHLIEHIKDDYFVPSLLVNAFRAKGYRTDQIGYHLTILTNDEGDQATGFALTDDGWGRATEVRRVLRDYLNKRLLPTVEEQYDNDDALLAAA